MGLIKELFNTFDKSKQGYIDKKSARGSSKMLQLVECMQKQLVGQKQTGKIYLKDLEKHYENYKKLKITKGRDTDSDICKSFVETMISRVATLQNRQSFLSGNDAKPFDEDD